MSHCPQGAKRLLGFQRELEGYEITPRAGQRWCWTTMLTRTAWTIWTSRPPCTAAAGPWFTTCSTSRHTTLSCCGASAGQTGSPARVTTGASFSKLSVRLWWSLHDPHHHHLIENIQLGFTELKPSPCRIFFWPLEGTLKMNLIRLWYCFLYCCLSPLSQIDLKPLQFGIQSG